MLYLDKEKVESNLPRNLWIDWAKGLCSLMVILMHCKKPNVYSYLCVPIFLPSFFL